MDSIALSALALSGLSFLWSWSTAYHTSQRATVISSLELLTADSVIGARSIVGMAARLEELDEIKKQEFIEAAFRLMWAIQGSVFAARTIRRTALAPQEAVWLYRHIEIITSDLNLAIRKHGNGINWDPALTHTNEVLNALPNKVKNEWSKLIAKKNFRLLELPQPTGEPSL